MKSTEGSLLVPMLVLGCCLAAPPASYAVATFSNTEAASLSLSVIGGTFDGEPDAQLDTVATESSVVSGDSQTSAAGAATVLGEVKAKADATSDNLDNIITSSASAGWTATLTTSGADPSAPIPLDLSIDISGELHYVNNGPDYGLLDIPPTATVAVAISFFTDDGTVEIPVFVENASLTGNGDPTMEPLIDATSDWVDDGDKNPGCNQNACIVTVSAIADLDGVLDVAFGEVFDLFVILTAAASTFGGDVHVASNFFDSVELNLSTTSDVSIDLVLPESVPEPGTALLVLMGFVIGARLRRT